MKLHHRQVHFAKEAVFAHARTMLADTARGESARHKRTEKSAELRHGVVEGDSASQGRSA
jgi:hypothetical protein